LLKNSEIFCRTKKKRTCINISKHALVSTRDREAAISFFRLLTRRPRSAARHSVLWAHTAGEKSEGRGILKKRHCVNPFFAFSFIVFFFIWVRRSVWGARLFESQKVLTASLACLIKFVYPGLAQFHFYSWGIVHVYFYWNTDAFNIISYASDI
jgi:hypothetical protein